MEEQSTPGQWSATFGPVSQISEIDRTRMLFWLERFGESGCSMARAKALHADECLAEFDKRFNKKEDAQ